MLRGGAPSQLDQTLDGLMHSNVATTAMGLLIAGLQPVKVPAGY